jgi:arginine decarboxylase
MLVGQIPESLAKDEHRVIQQLYETYQGVSRKNFQEAYHDALQLKEEAVTAFNLGFLDLKARARVEQMFYATIEKILKLVREQTYVPDELENMERQLTDTFYCNFSLFQSLPDHWAVRQLFPTLPIDRLNVRPTRRAVLADLTCDSDGKMDEFIDLRDVKHFLDVHPPNGEPYYIGTFLVGAYQEILGDLHNLFGDTNAVHIRIAESGYEITDLVHGDTVTEVLNYVQFGASNLLATFRRKVGAAKNISRQEANTFIAEYVAGLEGYTYLEGEAAR